MTSVKQLFTILTVDLKNIFRDGSLLFIFFVPFLMVFLLRFGIPPISEIWPQVTEYYSILISIFCLLSAIFPAFLVSFLMLDEKDDNINIIFKILPVYPNFIIIYRILLLFILGTVFCLIIILSNGLIHFNLGFALVLALTTGLISPIPVLLINAYASNKIEAVTWFKFINMILMIPIVSSFMKTDWSLIFGIIPSFYLLSAYQNFSWLWITIGTGYSVIIIIVCYQIYKRKN